MLQQLLSSLSLSQGNHPWLLPSYQTIDTGAHEAFCISNSQQYKDWITGYFKIIHILDSIAEECLYF